MQLDDTKSNYGWISIALHWAVFVVVAVLFVLGQQLEDLHPQSDAAKYIRGLHVSIGVTGAMVILARIFWRYRQGVPEKADGSAFLNAIAAAVRYALLAEEWRRGPG
jgi:cytochrome b561